MTGLPRWPSLYTLVGISGTVALAASGVFFCLNALALQTDTQRIAASVRRSFENPKRTIANSDSKHNDCMIVAMTLERDATFADLVISPKRLYYVERPGSAPLCTGLRQLAYRGEVDPHQFAEVFYHQYLHGQRVLFSFLLSVLSVQAIRTLFVFLCYGTLGVAALIALWQCVGLRKFRGAGSDEAASLFYEKITQGCFALTFLLCYDLPRKADSFTSAPTDLLLFTFLVVASLVNLHAMTCAARAVLFAGFGTLIAYFELLHGAAPLAIAVILGVLCGQHCPETAEPNRRQVCVEAVSAFTLAFLLCLAVKMAIVTLYFRINMFYHFVDLLNFRMSGALPQSIPESLKGIFSQRDVTIVHAMLRLSHKAGVLGFGSRWLGSALALSAIVVLLGYTINLVGTYKTVRMAQRHAGLLVSAGVIILWYGLFVAHTQLHADMMVRLLAWPLAVSVTLLIAWSNGLWRQSAGTKAAAR